MTLNEIFDIYGNRLPTKSYREYDGEILEWDFAIDPKLDDLKLIEQGIACDWQLIVDSGSWTQAIISRDRIKRELDKQAKHTSFRDRAKGREAKDWLTLTPEKADPIQDTYKEHYTIIVNHHGQITQRQSSWYSSENRYQEKDGASYIYEHRDSFGIHTKYNHSTRRLEWLSGKPKIESHARSTARTIE
jgi:hypothetical protein